jgi:hypothetical protein
VIDRPNNDGSSGVIYLYLGGTQPFGGPGSITQWSFFDNEASNATRSDAALVRAHGHQPMDGRRDRHDARLEFQRRADARVRHARGQRFVPGGHLYTIGFTHRGYTGSGATSRPTAATAASSDYTGYNDYSDRWAYAFGTAVLGTKLGTGGLTLDSAGLGGRIYSAKFTSTATLRIP